MKTSQLQRQLQMHLRAYKQPMQRLQGRLCKVQQQQETASTPEADSPTMELLEPLALWICSLMPACFARMGVMFPSEHGLAGMQSAKGVGLALGPVLAAFSPEALEPGKPAPPICLQLQVLQRCCVRVSHRVILQTQI